MYLLMDSVLHYRSLIDVLGIVYISFIHLRCIKVAVLTLRLKSILVQIVDSDHSNDLLKFEKDSPFHF